MIDTTATATATTATTSVATGTVKPRLTGAAWIRSHVPEIVGIPLLSILIIALWAWAVEAFDIRAVILPSPLAVWEGLVHGLVSDPTSPASFYYHAAVTLGEVVAGFGLGTILGLVLALLLSQIRLLERIANPLIVGFQSVPKVAVAPLFIIWFGFGAESKIALVTLIVFFPVLVAGVAGFKSVERERRDVMESMGATKWQSFVKLVLPGSLPFLFTGLEISLVQAMTATVVAEFLAGRAGLGMLIVQMGQVLDTAGIFAVLVVLGFIGWALVQILAVTRKRLLFWSAEFRGIR
jgi:NitT/TauT family transport system permease protein